MTDAAVVALSGDYVRDWLDLLLRWLHVVAGIAWIGASFYFVRLDLSLRPPREQRDVERGVAGEFWGVHGGGFYHSQKYRVAPETLPEPLHWFKWEAYTTWLSGFALLAVLYYADAEVRLVDPAVADLTTWQAVAASVAGIAGAWLVYDALCRALRRRAGIVLGIAVAALTVAAVWGAWQLFSARAAYLQVGAMLGTIMAANVLFTIIPAHRELVRAKVAGRDPDPAPAIEAKRRSVHNNYFTLPVVFTMLAGHFPATYGHERGWLVLVALMATAAWFRHFFNLWHTGRRAWAIPATSAVAVVAIAVAIEPDEPDGTAHAPVATTTVRAIAERRCATCHAGVSAPNGVRLETAAQLEARADEVARQVRTRAMPPGNSTRMTERERALVAAWARDR